MALGFQKCDYQILVEPEDEGFLKLDVNFKKTYHQTYA